MVYIGEFAEIDDLKCATLQAQCNRLRSLRNNARLALADPEHVTKYIST